LDWHAEYNGFEELKVAVMGCIVNSPRESKHADIGISLPGTCEDLRAAVYIDCKLDRLLKGGNIAVEFKTLVIEYISTTYIKLK